MLCFEPPPWAESSGDTSSRKRPSPEDNASDDKPPYEDNKPHVDDISYSKLSDNAPPTNESSNGKSSEDDPSRHVPPKIDNEPDDMDLLHPVVTSYICCF
ncbi:hypothetical protein FVEN_g12645 [Fusarium venenatum]|nr:hypothetical protein FVEN_g12645 [Fusarium venenatum]